MKKFINYNLVLHNKTDFDNCLKSDFKNLEYKVVDKGKISGIKEGRIYIAETIDSPVEWIDELNRYTQTQLDKKDYTNKSNKAVMMLKYKNKIFSIIYGYGRTMLNSSSIVKNFGLRTAVNLISDEDIKSLATLNISDYIDTQRQALNFVSQNSFFINTNSEIIKTISGKASKSSMFSSISGSDNIRFSASSEFTLQAVLDKLIEASESDSYKTKGFEWIDYIQPVKDGEIISILNDQLIATINSSEFDKVHICLNKVIDHGKVGGYFIKGMKQEMLLDNFYDEIPDEIFFEYLIKHSNSNLEKLKNSSLYFWNTETDEPEKLDNVYNCILFETDYKNERYLINNGDWFKLESSYFDRILSKIETIPRSSIQAIMCKAEWSEGKYNEEFVNTNQGKYKLFDKDNFQATEWGRSKVEPADIVTNEGQFLHIKKGGSSAPLSHLFAQGLVSSQLLKNEQEFRNYIDSKVSQEFGGNFIDSINPEIIFGIIDKRFDKTYKEFLPVFSMINLCQVYDNITNLGYKCSILPIKKDEKVPLKTNEQKVLEWIQGNLIGGRTIKEISEQIPSNYNIKESRLKNYLKKFQEELGLIEVYKEEGKSKKYRLVAK